MQVSYFVNVEQGMREMSLCITPVPNHSHLCKLFTTKHYSQFDEALLQSSQFRKTWREVVKGRIIGYWQRVSGTSQLM